MKYRSIITSIEKSISDERIRLLRLKDCGSLICECNRFKFDLESFGLGWDDNSKVVITFLYQGSIDEMEDAVVELADIYKFAPMKSVYKGSANYYTYTLITLPFEYRWPITSLTLYFRCATKTLPEGFQEVVESRTEHRNVSQITCKMK